MMSWSHGLLQAFGFATCGLIALAIEAPPLSLHAPGIPFSRLAAHTFVGRDFFSRSRLLSAQKPESTGIVDSMETFRREDFDPSLLPLAVRDFYEDTSKYRLLVMPRWQKGFRVIGLILRKIGGLVGQMRFPVVGEKLHDEIASRIVRLDDRADGRLNVRGWIRNYDTTAHEMYVAAYATHSLGACTFMNIAFPFPAGNLTSILHLMWLGANPADGLLLTTLKVDSSGEGDQGVYFANRLCPLRLPINETISVWSAEQAPHELKKHFPDDPTAFGRHDIWIFGIRFLSLDYAILRTDK